MIMQSHDVQELKNTPKVTFWPVVKQPVPLFPMPTDAPGTKPACSQLEVCLLKAWRQRFDQQFTEPWEKMHMRELPVSL